ncbi:hypothetical protein [Pseudonocardia sp. NPDC049635]|uniref:hypothetical protein n=1 Tax=Pseudonocardia sp. NPDC049635 TaxID=3155506 RepID=UPI0033EC37CB
MTVNVHVFETTSFPVRVHPREDRVTVDVEGSGGSVTLYLDRPDLVRLREVLDVTERELTARQNENKKSNEVRAVSGPAA